MRTKKKLRVSKKQQQLFNKQTMDALLEQYKALSDEEIYKLPRVKRFSKALSMLIKLSLYCMDNEFILIAVSKLLILIKLSLL